MCSKLSQSRKDLRQGSETKVSLGGLIISGIAQIAMSNLLARIIYRSMSDYLMIVTRKDNNRFNKWFSEW